MIFTGYLPSAFLKSIMNKWNDRFGGDSAYYEVIGRNRQVLIYNYHMFMERHFRLEAGGALQEELKSNPYQLTLGDIRKEGDKFVQELRLYHPDFVINGDSYSTSKHYKMWIFEKLKEVMGHEVVEIKDDGGVMTTFFFKDLFIPRTAEELEEAGVNIEVILRDPSIE